MIRAMVFDLDGTLLQTEKLKALSYARAAIELCPDCATEDEVIAAFKDVVGLSRAEVAKALLKRFHLGEAAKARMADFGVTKPWQTFVQVRLEFYNQMLEDPDLLREHEWPHNVHLLELARRENCKTALATMSYCKQVRHILRDLGWTDKFDFIATRDDVHQGKPDPEIYELVAQELAVAPQECLVIEDSPTGVKAALTAGMHVVAVSTPFTYDHLHKMKLIDKRWIVDDSDRVPGVVEAALNEHRAE